MTSKTRKRPCAKCEGKGAIRFVFPHRKAQPCYWFNSGACTCDKCNGTGEEE